jgi:hypothetical protein
MMLNLQAMTSFVGKGKGGDIEDRRSRRYLASGP